MSVPPSSPSDSGSKSEIQLGRPPPQETDLFAEQGGSVYLLPEIVEIPEEADIRRRADTSDGKFDLFKGQAIQTNSTWNHTRLQP